MKRSWHLGHFYYLYVLEVKMYTDLVLEVKALLQAYESILAFGVLIVELIVLYTWPSTREQGLKLRDVTL